MCFAGLDPAQFGGAGWAAASSCHTCVRRCHISWWWAAAAFSLQIVACFEKQASFTSDSYLFLCVYWLVCFPCYVYHLAVHLVYFVVYFYLFLAACVFSCVYIVFKSRVLPLGIYMFLFIYIYFYVARNSISLMAIRQTPHHTCHESYKDNANSQHSPEHLAFYPIKWA